MELQPMLLRSVPLSDEAPLVSHKGERKGTGKRGRPKGVPNRQKMDVASFCRSILEDEVYRESLRVRLVTGRIDPRIEQMVWEYAYGKPSVHIAVTDKRDEIRIVHDDVVDHDAIVAQITG